MKLLPILALLVTCYSLPVTPAYAQEDPQPEVVGTIPSEEEEPDIYSREIIESIPANARPPVGVQPDQLQFPDFRELTNTTDKALPLLLPKNLLKDLTPQEDLEKKLEGKIFHPVCKVEGKKPDKKITEKVSNIDTPEWWPVALSRTKLAQAIGVPGFSSWVKFQTAEGEADRFGEEENDPIDCKTVLAVNDNQAEPENSENRSEVFPSILSWVQDLINKFIGQFVPPITVELHPKKFLQGETEFAEQAGREKGFLRAFAPTELLSKEAEFDGEENTPYEKPGEKQTNINYQGVAGARKGYQRLAESLYPAELQGFAHLTPSGSLDFSIPYRDASFQISDDTKQKIIQETLAKFPKSKIADLWNTVVSRAIAAGINPAFALAIWIEESGAGAITSEKGSSDFGCFPGGNTSLRVPFEQSLSCFINFTSKEHPNDFTEWMRYFCGPGAVPICSNNPNFIRRIKEHYEKFGPTTPISNF